jgi:hypothetical protein
MKIEYISENFKEILQTFNRETLSMCPYETANFLLKCGEVLLKYMEYSNKQYEPNSEALLSANEKTKIDNLFRELGDNFFPMAHTTAPLRELKIVNARQYEDLNARVEYLLRNFIENYGNNLATSIEINERNIRLNHEVLDEIKKVREEVKFLLNP